MNNGLFEIKNVFLKLILLMIYITGNTHSDFTRFFTDKFSIQKEMTKNDYVIICGDFGGVWNYLVESTYERYWLNWLNEKNFTTLFVDEIMKILQDYIIIQ